MSEADMLTAAGWSERGNDRTIRRHWTKDGVDWYTEAEALHEVLATQLEQMRRERDEACAELADLRARGVVPDADCTCGSGGHPRACARHPHRMEMHAREIDTENALDEARTKLARIREACAGRRYACSKGEPMTDNNRKENMTRSFCDADECDPALPPEMLRVNESQAWRDLFAGLTPDEVRVITGLVKAMRETRVSAVGDSPYARLSRARISLDCAHDFLDVLPEEQPEARVSAASAAWHVAHAISQMGES